MPCRHMLAFSRTLLCNKPSALVALHLRQGSFQITGFGVENEPLA